MPQPFDSLALNAEGLTLHARQSRADGSPAVLFLHGWLDHSHSFDWVAEHLPTAWRLLLLDFRGMGRSAHVPPGVHYHFADYLADVEAALRGTGLRQVHLVGHSLGGIVATAYAAARPESTLSLTLLESLGPAGGGPEGAPARLRDFLESLERQPRRKSYPSVEVAAARLREANSSLPEAAALHLARHGTEPVEGGVAFRFDPRHRRRFAYGYDEAQWLAVLAAVQCPVQLVLGSHGMGFEDEQARARLAALRAPPPQVLPGGHHVHLEQPHAVATLLREFIR